jgi:hypothetical protein
MPCPPHSPSFDLPNNIWWWVQIMKLPIVQLSTLSCYFIRLRNSKLYHILKVPNKSKISHSLKEHKYTFKHTTLCTPLKIHLLLLKDANKTKCAILKSNGKHQQYWCCSSGLWHHMDLYADITVSEKHWYWLAWVHKALQPRTSSSTVRTSNLTTNIIVLSAWLITSFINTAEII